MKRLALAATTVAMAASACSSSGSAARQSSAPGDPPAPVTETPLQYLYFGARNIAAGCGDAGARLVYGGGSGGYVVVAIGRFACPDDGGPARPGRTKPPPATVLTMDGTVDRFGKFVVTQLGTGTSAGPVPELHPLPAPPMGWKPPAPLPVLKELVVRHAAGCGEQHPTGLAYAVTTQGDADRFSMIDYTIPGGRMPIYVVVARGHFSCPHAGKPRPVSSTMMIWLPADGSGLEPIRIITDNRTATQAAPLGGHLTPLS